MSTDLRKEPASTTHNPYLRMIRDTWGQWLHEVLEGIDDCSGMAAIQCLRRWCDYPRYEPMRKIAALNDGLG